MKIFVLEDDVVRIAAFRTALAGADYVLCEDIDSALTAFNEPFDYVFLDHDLGGRAFVLESERNTGSEFVRQRGHLLKDAKYVVIHSWNIEAAKHMRRALIKDFYLADSQIVEAPFGVAVTDFAVDLAREQHQQLMAA